MNKNNILKDYFNLNNRNNVSKKNKGILRYNDIKINIGPIYILTSPEKIRYTKFQEIDLRTMKTRNIWTGYFYCRINEKNKNDMFDLLEVEDENVFLDLCFRSNYGDDVRFTYFCREIYSKQLSSSFFEFLREFKFNEPKLFKFKANKREKYRL
jgi:hypothetical protein